MRESRSGAIVNVSSIRGKEGNASAAPYGVTRAEVICLTKALAKEVIHDGVRVNAVAPALIETPLLSAHTEGHRTTDRQNTDGTHGPPGGGGSRRPFLRLRRRELRHRPVLRRERGPCHVLDTS